jgi:MauM/NapG family ferredoxin protein
MDFSRRSFVGACVAGAALPAAYGAARATGALPSNVQLLRPPGALEGDAFLNLCVRCGECLKVCVTNGLQPVLLEAGPAGVFTPKLVPRTGHCEYNCTQCLDVCPTGAIRPLDLEAKQKFIMGEAVFDEELCLPLIEEDDCIVCEEHCPLPEKAIKLEEVEVDHPEYGPITLRKPSVDLDLCIGCGICENVCPLEDAPGVVTVPVSEERGDVNAEIVTRSPVRPVDD